MSRPAESPTLQHLPHDEIHVLYTPTSRAANDDLLARYEALLSEDERTRHQRFLFEKDRTQFLIARALLRTGLSHYVAVEPADWQFVTNRYGKPEIRTPNDVPPLRFSLSHTAGMVACGFTKTRDLGVDVEDMQRRGRLLEVADHFFSAAEVADLKSTPAADQRSRFFDFWTLKESYIKARGMGLSIPLRKFSFCVNRSAPVTVDLAEDLHDDAAHWQFAQFDPNDRHRIAVATRRRAVPDLRIVFRETVPLVP